MLKALVRRATARDELARGGLLSGGSRERAEFYVRGALRDLRAAMRLEPTNEGVLQHWLTLSEKHAAVAHAIAREKKAPLLSLLNDTTGADSDAASSSSSFSDVEYSLDSVSSSEEL